MTDHYHYDYADQRHDHRGDYAPERHEHSSYEVAGVAEEHHRHYDTEKLLSDTAHALKSTIDGLLRTVEIYGEIIEDLRDRIYALEQSTPEARQLQYEADVAMADRYEDE